MAQVIKTIQHLIFMTSKFRLYLGAFFTVGACALSAQSTFAQSGKYKPGQKIAWHERIYDKWEAGTFVGETPSGSQPIIQKRPGDPNSQTAFDWNEIKPLAEAAIDAAPAGSGKFKPGQKIWYRVGGTWPAKWEQGTFVEETPGGKQPIIRLKPNQFHPNGAQTAYVWEDVKDQPPAGGAEPDAPQPAKPKPGAGGVQGGKPAGPDGPPLTEDEILKFLSDRLGTNPFADSAILQKTKNDLGALIKKRGTAFLHNSAVSDFGQKISAFGMTSEVTGPLGHNFGPPNTQDWLFGSWVTSKTGLPVHYVEGNKRITWTEIGAANTGKVTINKDGTYIWNTDSAQGVIQGRWHEASVEEMADQGGAGVVLENAKNGEAWVAFKYRASNPGEEWLGLAEVNHRSIREGAMRVPAGGN